MLDELVSSAKFIHQVAGLHYRASNNKVLCGEKNMLILKGTRPDSFMNYISSGYI